MSEMTMLVTTARTVTSEEIRDMIFGTGATSWEWWRKVTPEQRDGADGYFIRHEPVEEGDDGMKWVSEAAIALAAGEYLSKRELNSDEQDAARESLGYLDASGADNVLQRAVFGELVFG